MSKSLSSLVTEIEDNLVPGAAMTLDSVKKVDCDVCSFGIPLIDKMTGMGGIPRGRITEIYGPEGCGKTTFCLHIIAEANREGKKCGFIDAEHALSIRRMEALGIKKDMVILSQPDNGEQALEVAEIMLRSSSLSAVIVDSVAALTPKVEIEKDMGDATMGSHARLMSQAMRKLVAVTAKSNTALIFTNQLRAKIGGFFPESTTTGGNALKFYASLRISLKRLGGIEDQNGKKLASRYQATVVKNKIAVPFSQQDYCVNGTGIYMTDKKGKQIAEQAESEES